MYPARRESYSEKQKKRCDLCKESSRCKNQGKCELCNRFCKDSDVISPTETPILGNIQNNLQNDIVSNDVPDRYYTIGTFGPGPKQNLLVRLLDISRKHNLDSLVVLAKSSGNGKRSASAHPLILDTANVFKVEKSVKEADAEIHPIQADNIQPTNLDLASTIDYELQMAIQEKSKMLGDAQLTRDEVDKVIQHALLQVSQLFYFFIFSRTFSI